MPPDILRAAGMMLRNPEGAVLFCKRADTGEWAFPGGRIEGDELAPEAAAREVFEETGAEVTTAVDHMRRIKDGVDFTTLSATVDTFEPKLCGEHTGYAWAMPDAPPEPLHPGARVALSMIDPTELDVARLISTGDLTSPQFFKNVWLFAIRITGTGAAYRSNGDEFTWRNPDDYLTEEFLARCNGLTVIYEHPEKATLDSEEFADRVIGSVMLPYIQGDEVWSVARIYDDNAAQEMRDKQMSTSPCVVLRGADSAIEMEDGSKLLIEGKPSLLDHVAICAQGVWDKGGAPTGVLSENIGDQNMADENDDKKADADPMKALADSVAALAARMDASDKAKADAECKADEDDKEEEKADAEDEEKSEDKKADDDDDKEDKKADAALIAANADLKAKLADLDRRVPKILSDADLDAVSAAQARADSVASIMGEHAPRPMQGEAPLSYRRRLASKFKPHSDRWKDIDLAKADDAMLKIAEDDIYGAARKTAEAPATVAPGQLRAMVKADSTGRQITTFIGDPDSWMRDFKAPRKEVSKFNQSQGA